jgi:nicotinate-nucleotide adenylyltransferase
MVKTACAELNLPVTVSDVENALPQPSYTVNTLAALSKMYPDKKWSLLIGSDNLANFSKWKDFRTIADNYQLLVYPRKGFENENLYLVYNAIKIDAPTIDVSSTFIRKNISDESAVKKYLPSGVYEYIRKNGLYGLYGNGY